jgi:hypothetical protein
MYVDEKLYSEFEVLTAMFMKSSIFWDITSCSLLQFSGFSEGLVVSIFILLPAFHGGFLLDLFFDPEDGGDMLLREAR